MVPATRFGRGGRIPIEVKGDNESAISRAQLAIAKTFGSGLVLSRSRMELEGDVPVLPAPLLLAALPEQTRRDLALG